MPKVHEGILSVQRFIVAFSKLCEGNDWAKAVSINPSTYGFYVSSKDNTANVVVEVFDDRTVLHYRVNSLSAACPIIPLSTEHTDFNTIVERVYEFIKENHNHA